MNNNVKELEMKIQPGRQGREAKSPQHSPLFLPPNVCGHQ